LRELTGNNLRKVVFLDAALTPGGDLLDQWGNAYHIYTSPDSFLIRSSGENGIFDDGPSKNRDDILVEYKSEL
jgi:hypothetical protein